jgi:hypothetical protein
VDGVVRLLVISLALTGCSSGGGGSSAPGGELTAQLAGDWSTNTIVSGAPAWWSRGRLTVTSTGATTGRLAFLGDPDEVVTTTMSLSADRLWTLGVNGTAQGSVDCLDRLIAFTTDWPRFPTPHPTEMGLGVRMAPSYAPSDLAGTWEARSLAAGDGTAYWDLSLYSIAADGTFLSTTLTNTAGLATTNGRLFLSPDGVTTLAGSASFRGAMDALKTLMVSTATVNGGSRAELRVWVKRGAAYSQADLVGTWRSYALASGPGEPWWERGSGVIDANGAFSGTTLDSAGNAGPRSAVFTMLANGQVEITGAAPGLAVLDASKSVLAWVTTWSGASPGTAELTVLVKIR